jgi:tripartite-type tricarboxylate transporter receptor subunit TctC
MRPRHLIMICVAGVAALAAGQAAAADYPARPVRLVVAFAPGGSVDVVARLLAQKLSERWKQQVVVDNRPGAGGNVSAEIVARAQPDGYTLYMTSAALVVNPSLYASVPYDPVRDFTPISLVATVQSVLVSHPAVPVKSVKDLIALAKSRPGQINYGSTGSGTSGHLMMELFRSMAGIDLVHVPYKVIGQTYADLISGQVSLFFPTAPGALPHIQAGRVRALGVAGANRSAALPGVPTIAESGVPGFDAGTWYPLLAPARTPRVAVETVHRDLVHVLGLPDIRERLTAAGIEIVGGAPHELARHIHDEIPKWARVIKQSGARPD